MRGFRLTVIVDDSHVDRTFGACAVPGIRSSSDRVYNGKKVGVRDKVKKGAHRIYSEDVDRRLTYQKVDGFSQGVHF
jgi:hypothetical protein